MTEKEFRWLRRSDLIEIIYTLQEHEKKLQSENEALKQQLAERKIMIENAGSLAEVSAQLNGLFEAAQATAEEYLRSIRESRQEDPLTGEEADLCDLDGPKGEDA